MSAGEIGAGLHRMQRLGPLLSQPAEVRDRAWLEAALQAAVSLELSTIPPYLCALWSVIDPMDPVAASIRNVVQEEMLHMALACNMLTALQATPRIADPDTVPVYPGPIPGGVHEGLTVALSGLTDTALDVFIAIEAPSADAVPGAPGGIGDKTIGAFYAAVRAAFHDLRPALCTDRQVTGPLAWMVMENLAAVDAAIMLIVDQGEGSTTGPDMPGSHDLAHYWRFRELREGRRIGSLNPDGQPRFDGAPVPMPAVWPMATVPAGGWRAEDVPAGRAAVREGLAACDRAYTELLNRLQIVWELGDQGALVHGIETMFGMSETARALMQEEIAPGRGTYGPCFRYIERPKGAGA